MDPSDFTVPGTLLRTAGDGQTHVGQEPSHDGDVPAFSRARWWDGAPPTLLVLTLLGVGLWPLVAAVVVGVGLALLGVLLVTAGRRASREEAKIQLAAGLSPDAPLAAVAHESVLTTTRRLGRRRGIQDLLVLAVPIGAVCFALPRFGGRILERHLDVAHDERSAVLLIGVVLAALLSPLAVVALQRITRRTADPDRLAAGLAVVAISVPIGFTTVAPTKVVFVALLALGAAAVLPWARAVTRCIAATAAPRERAAAWLLISGYALLVGGLVGTVLLDLVAGTGHTRVALWLLAPAGFVVGLSVAARASRRTTARESAALIAEVRERRSAQERIEQGIEPPAVEARDLCFSFGAQPVLRDITLAVAQGEVAALLGTNGAGKSTLLRVIAGLLPPERGTVRLYGEPTATVGAEDLGSRGIALVLGGGMTFPGLTVAETLRLTAIALPDPAHVEEVYGRFPVLWDRRNQRTGTLSGGEQQMLAVGRALITRPRLLLIDELTLGLAPKIVGELVELVGELAGRGTTVVLVEQSVNIATQLATHAFFLERGQVRYDGPTDELLDRDDLLRSVFLASA